MADKIAEGTAKLQLDEETGDMVSKAELKKRIAKRAKKQAQAKAKSEAPRKAPGEQVEAVKSKDEALNPNVEPTSMFSQGFLSEVYKERPVESVFTRFPPEPNGYLHIGHAKAIAVNFGFARYHGGNCYLRFDDTNPSGERKKYFTAIESMVQWLGFTPYRVTYASDNFDLLYQKAEDLIKQGKAYVCYCGEADIKLQRGGEEGARIPRYRCEHAAQSTEHNLSEFRAMQAGKYRPKEAFLRMMQDIENGNPQMWDLAAYRILAPKDADDTEDAEDAEDAADAEVTEHAVFAKHPRTSNKWKIYPTYDFAHCLCDSFENITHSLCTTEFVLSRVSYEWLNSTLKVYEPMQREYGRLNITGTVLSKRKIRKLVDEKHVRGWDDPRLYTLIGIKRRGVPPGAILAFVNELGVTTAATNIQLARFDQTVRRYLELTVPRLMLVLDPIPVIIKDVEEMELENPFSPKVPAMGSHKVRLTKTLYIERSDFRELDSPDYYRLAPGKSVGLLHLPHPVKAESFKKVGDKVTEIQAVYDKESRRPKTYIHWVPEGSREVEVRIHNQLFKSERPEVAEGGFLNDLNPNSEEIWPHALIESGFDEVKASAPWPKTAGETEPGNSNVEAVRFQAMRVAYMAMDSDSTDEKIVLNRIVSLKEDAGK